MPASPHLIAPQAILDAGQHNCSGAPKEIVWNGWERQAGASLGATTQNHLFAELRVVLDSALANPVSYAAADAFSEPVMLFS